MTYTESVKIVGIVGILDFPRSEDRVWSKLRPAFTETFPDASFVVEHSLYLPWQGKKIRTFADALVEKYDTGEEIILLGYNLGGIIACAIAPRFTKSRIRSIVTIGSPHRLRFFYSLLRTEPKALPAPVYTFAGVLDPVVPWFLTSYPNDHHTTLLSDHLFGFVASKRPASTVAKTIAMFDPHHAIAETTA